MIRKEVKLFSTEADEIHIPLECLAELGLGAGAWAVVEATPERLLLVGVRSLREVQTEVGGIARELEGLGDRLRRLAQSLPQPAAARESELPPDRGAAAELQEALECAVSDGIEPAVRTLEAAARSSS